MRYESYIHCTVALTAVQVAMDNILKLENGIQNPFLEGFKIWLYLRIGEGVLPPPAVPLFSQISPLFRSFSQNCEKRLLASSCLSVCLSARMERFGSHRAGFHEMRCLRIFQSILKKINVSLKLDKNRGCVT